MPPSSNALQIKNLDPYRSEIEKLYVNKDPKQRMTNAQICEHLKKKYNIDVKPKKLDYYLRDKWKIRKNLKAEDYHAAYDESLKRKICPSDASVDYNGMMQDQKKMNRGYSRYRSDFPTHLRLGKSATATVSIQNSPGNPEYSLTWLTSIISDLPSVELSEMIIDVLKQYSAPPSYGIPIDDIFPSFPSVLEQMNFGAESDSQEDKERDNEEDVSTSLKIAESLKYSDAGILIPSLPLRIGSEHPQLSTASHSGYIAQLITTDRQICHRSVTARSQEDLKPTISKFLYLVNNDLLIKERWKAIRGSVCEKTFLAVIRAILRKETAASKTLAESLMRIALQLYDPPVFRLIYSYHLISDFWIVTEVIENGKASSFDDAVRMNAVCGYYASYVVLGLCSYLNSESLSEDTIVGYFPHCCGHSTYWKCQPMAAISIAILLRENFSLQGNDLSILSERLAPTLSGTCMHPEHIPKLKKDADIIYELVTYASRLKLGISEASIKDYALILHNLVRCICPHPDSCLVYRPSPKKQSLQKLAIVSHSLGGPGILECYSQKEVLNMYRLAVSYSVFPSLPTYILEQSIRKKSPDNLVSVLQVGLESVWCRTFPSVLLYPIMNNLEKGLDQMIDNSLFVRGGLINCPEAFPKFLAVFPNLLIHSECPPSAEDKFIPTQFQATLGLRMLYKALQSKNNEIAVILLEKKVQVDYFEIIRLVIKPHDPNLQFLFILVDRFGLFLSQVLQIEGATSAIMLGKDRVTYEQWELTAKLNGLKGLEYYISEFIVSGKLHYEERRYCLLKILKASAPDRRHEIGKKGLRLALASVKDFHDISGILEAAFPFAIATSNNFFDLMPRKVRYLCKDLLVFGLKRMKERLLEMAAQMVAQDGKGGESELQFELGNEFKILGTMFKELGNGILEMFQNPRYIFIFKTSESRDLTDLSEHLCNLDGEWEYNPYVKGLEWLLDNGLDVNARWQNESERQNEIPGHPLILIICRSEYPPEMVKKLAERGVDIDACYKGYTAMRSVLILLDQDPWYTGRLLRLVKVLLECKANPDGLGCGKDCLSCGVSDSLNRLELPIFFAMRYGNFEILAWLLSAGCDVNIRNREEERPYQTPLGAAVYYGRIDFVSCLLQTSVNGESIEEALKIATEKRYLAMIEKLRKAQSIIGLKR